MENKRKQSPVINYTTVQDEKAQLLFSIIWCYKLFSEVEQHCIDLSYKPTWHYVLTSNVSWCSMFQIEQLPSNFRWTPAVSAIFLPHSCYEVMKTVINNYGRWNWTKILTLNCCAFFAKRIYIFLRCRFHRKTFKTNINNKFSWGQIKQINACAIANIYELSEIIHIYYTNIGS